MGTSENLIKNSTLTILIICSLFIVLSFIQQRTLLSSLASHKDKNSAIKTLGTLQQQQHITAYNPVSDQTDDTPFITASADYVRDGIVALSYDLERTLELEFGDIVVLETRDGKFLGEFEFQDRMNKRWRNKVDIFMWKVQDAKKFGKVPGRMYVKRRQSVHRLEKDV
jgi:3D (Asp-Asp-Asp) domain-containing protein